MPKGQFATTPEKRSRKTVPVGSGLPVKKLRRSDTNPARQRTNQKRRGDFEWSTILVPVDFSPGSLKALDLAVSLARHCGASVVLLHVLDLIFSRGHFDSPRLRPLRSQALADAKQQLTTLARRRVRPHVPVIHRVVLGVAYSVIVEAASKAQADLVVMGSERRTGLNRFLVGSVAERAVRHARCPVLVVRDTAR